MTGTLAALLPSGISEFFEWDGIAFKDTVLELNKTGIMAMISTLICVAIFFGMSRKRALVPTGGQNVAEGMYELVEKNISVEVLGEEGKGWTPYLALLFFWIFFINIWSIIPGIQFPATSRIAIPMMLALVTWGIFIAVGFKNQGPLYIFKAIFPPGVPKALLPLIGLIELISKFLIRPFSLMVRLFANMVAGHILLVVFAIMCQELLRNVLDDGQIVSAFIIPLSFAGLVAITAFEVLVAVLQAYIFTVLTAVYIGDSMHEEH